MTEKDLKIHKEFSALGKSRRECTNALLSLLPEIDRDKIWQKAGFSSIYEYALRLAGLSTRLVNKALKIDQKLAEMPELKSLIKSQGLSKIEIISRVASKDTEKFWCEKARTMTRDGLQRISLHEKAYQKTMGEPLLGTDKVVKVAEVQKMAENLGYDTVKIELTRRAKEAFYALKKDLPALSNRDALELMLLELVRRVAESNQNPTPTSSLNIYSKAAKHSPLKITNHKNLSGDFSSHGKKESSNQSNKSSSDIRHEKVIFTGPSTNDHIIVPLSKSHRPRVALAKNSKKLSCGKLKLIKNKSLKDSAIQSIRKLTKIRLLTTQKIRPSRHIPALIRKSISNTCSFPGCLRPRDHIHHPIHFSHHANHISLKPLCKVHHKILHQSIVKNQSSKEEDWVYKP